MADRKTKRKRKPKDDSHDSLRKDPSFLEMRLFASLTQREGDLEARGTMKVVNYYKKLTKEIKNECVYVCVYV